MYINLVNLLTKNQVHSNHLVVSTLIERQKVQPPKFSKSLLSELNLTESNSKNQQIENQN